MLQQQLLEVVLRRLDEIALMIVVNLLTIVFRKRFKALATKEENSNFRKLLSWRDISSLLEKFLKLLLPSNFNEKLR
jgi:hypothetical protein